MYKFTRRVTVNLDFMVTIFFNVKYTAILTLTDCYEVVYDPSTGAILNDIK